MHENGFDAMACGLNRRAHSGKTAADHAELGLMFDCFHDPLLVLIDQDEVAVSVCFAI